MKALLVTRLSQPEGADTIDVMSTIAFLRGIGMEFERSLVEYLPDSSTINSRYDCIIIPSLKAGFDGMIDNAAITVPMFGLSCTATEAQLGATPGVSARGIDARQFISASWMTTVWAAALSRLYTLSDGTALITSAPTDPLTDLAQTYAGEVLSWSTATAGNNRLYISGIPTISGGNILPLLFQAAINDGRLGSSITKVPWVSDLDHPNGYAAHEEPELLDTYASLLLRAGGTATWCGFQSDSPSRFENMSQAVLDKLVKYQNAPFKYCYHEHGDGGAFQPTSGTFPTLVEKGFTDIEQRDRYANLAAVWESKVASNGKALSLHYPAYYNSGANSFDSVTPRVFTENYDYRIFRSTLASPNPAGIRGGLRYNAYKTQQFRYGLQIVPTASVSYSQSGAPFASISDWTNEFQEDMEVLIHGVSRYYHDQDFQSTTQEPGVQRHGVATLTHQGDLLLYLRNIAVPFPDPVAYTTDRRIKNMPTIITNTVGAGQDYETLTAWETGVFADEASRDLVNLDRAYVVNVMTADIVDNWVPDRDWKCDATRNVTIQAGAGLGHSGTPGTGVGFIATTSRLINLAVISPTYFVNFRFKRLEFHLDLASGEVIRLAPNAATLQDIEFDQCIFRQPTRTSTGRVVQMADNARLKSCLVVGNVASPAGEGIAPESASTGACYVSNTVSVGFTYGFRNQSTADFELKNCVSYGSATSAYGGTFAAGSTNNASDQATADDLDGIDLNFVTDIVSGDFIDAAGLNFRPSGPASQIYQVGATLAADFNKDLINNTFITPWDIGAFSTASQGNSKDPLAANQSFKLAIGGTIPAQATGDPTTGAGDVSLWLPGAVDISRRQSVVGTIRVLKRYIMNNLSTIAATGPTVVWAPAGASLPGVTVGGSPTTADIRIELGATAITAQASHVIDETVEELIDAFLEASTGN